jgi:cyanate permease
MFGIVTSIPAIVFGHISLAKYKKNQQYEGKKIAVAGIVLGYLGILITVCIVLRLVSIYYGYEK